MDEEKEFDRSLLDRPDFHLLNKTRRDAVIALSSFILALFLLLMLLLSPLSTLAETSVFLGSVINYGLILNLGFVLTCCLIASYYSWWSTKKLDPLREKVISSLHSVSPER